MATSSSSVAPRPNWATAGVITNTVYSWPGEDDNIAEELLHVATFKGGQPVEPFTKQKSIWARVDGWGEVWVRYDRHVQVDHPTLRFAVKVESLWMPFKEFVAKFPRATRPYTRAYGAIIYNDNATIHNWNEKGEDFEDGPPFGYASLVQTPDDKKDSDAELSLEQPSRLLDEHKTRKRWAAVFGDPDPKGFEPSDFM